MGLVGNLHSWNKRTICRQRSAIEDLLHVDDGIETESKVKKLNRPKGTTRLDAIDATCKQQTKAWCQSEDRRFVRSMVSERGQQIC
jgi:hypothetical protein